ncbi:MAG: hypothetical protein EPO20_08665 [Betaproteobacteria bacterium]|nr:MAG: hypothetical protein EPO20_08665 [Betaproteobacteria bacterium]
MAFRILVALLIAFPVWAAEVAGVQIDDKARVGDTEVSLTGAETRLLVGGKPVGKPIAGEDFYRALLRIWLGEKPVQDDLKKALAGA